MKTLLENIKKRRPAVVLSVSESNDLAFNDKTIIDNIDIIEFRADLSPFMNNIARLKEEVLQIREHKLPVLLTFRSPFEGGKAYDDENKRLQIYNELAAYADMIDVEISSKKILKAIVAANPEKVIISSFHDFENTPNDAALARVYYEGRESGADMVKIACMPNSDEDLRRLLKLAIGDNRDLITVIAMGDRGAVSRIFFPAAGSLLTYSFFGEETAPGQIEIKRLIGMIKEFYPDKS